MRRLYKRPKLLFEDQNRLTKIAEQAGGLQLVFAGKAHPGDELGKFLIQDIIQMRHELARQGIRLVYLENYNMRLAQTMVAGVDVWAQYSASTNGSVGDKWDEGCHEWGAESKRPRWMVD